MEGNRWFAESVSGVIATNAQRYSGNVVFSPRVDSDTNTMLNSDLYSRESFGIRQPIDNGNYLIYLWVAENYRSNFRSFHVKLEGVQVTAAPIGSMPLNQWRKYGPYKATVTDRYLNMELVRVTGDPTLSGMAIYLTDAPPPDTKPPSIPANLSAAAKTHNSVSLVWSASTDENGVAGYDVLTNGSLSGTTSSTGYTVTGLSPNTSYSFTVRAYDAAGNRSLASQPVVVRTDAPPGGGTFVKGVNFNGGAVRIEGNGWLAEAAAALTLSPVSRHAGNTEFSPPVDSAMKVMLNSDIYSASGFTVSQKLPNGKYQIYLWVAENYRTNFRSFHVKLENVQVTPAPIGAMPLNQWRKYGPYDVTVNDGTLNMELVKVTGDATLVGMAVFKID